MTTSKKAEVAVVILAAGQGTRMKSALPKVMHELNGRPLVDYVVASAQKLGVKPVVVVSADNNLAREFLGERADFVVQEKQKGTGHAVASAENFLKDKAGNIIVLYGDMPFISDESLAKLLKRHLERGNTITMMTAVLHDFNDWRAPFCGFGRVVRGADGHIAKIVEKKDASAAELEIKEINPSYFCFKADWLWKNLKELKNENAQGEYYLTDLVKNAIEQGEKISSIEIDPKEAMGVNSQEDLKNAHLLR